MSNRCDGCNQFATIVDSYVPRQDPYSKEPSKVIHLCQLCVDEDIRNWKRFGWMPMRQIKAAYEEQLAKDMGFIWKKDSIDGQGIWVKPAKIKKGKYIIEEVIDDGIEGTDRSD